MDKTHGFSILIHVMNMGMMMSKSSYSKKTQNQKAQD